MSLPPATSRGFDQERLDVYILTLEFISLAREVVRGLPKGRSSLADQLERASSSIAFNIAEGCGEFSKGDKVRFFRIALRSAAECSAILDVAQRWGHIDPAKQDRGKAMLNRVAAMLQALIRRYGGS